MGGRLLRLAIGLLLFRAAIRSAPSPAAVEQHPVGIRRRWHSAVRRHWLPALLVVVAAALAVGGLVDWGDRLPGKDFYSFGAQTFPVLLVALAVELREPPRRVGTRPFITILVALGVGELLAVLALSGTISPDPKTYENYAGALVAWNECWSKLFATAVAVSLAWAVIGLLGIALCSTLASDATSEGQGAPPR